MTSGDQETQAPVRYSLAFVVIVAVFVTCLITANITAVKLVGAYGLVLDAGTLIFPISYIFGDVLTEVYGFRVARRVIWLGFLCNLLAVLTISLAGFLPAAPFGTTRAPTTASSATPHVSWRLPLSLTSSANSPTPSSSPG